LPTPKQADEQLTFCPHLVKTDAPVLHNQFLKRGVHRAGLPNFANDFERHRTVLVHGIPRKSNLQALCHSIIGKTTNPTVVNGMVFDWERIQQVLAIDNPVPATCTPM
jgi:hypothetical protein